MTTDLEIEPTLNTSSKLHDLSHTPSFDRSYTSDMPPSPPPHTIPPEMRHLREHMLLEWLHTLNCNITLAQLCDDEQLASFVSALTGIAVQRHNALTVLQSWLDVEYLPTESLVESDIIAFLSFILTQYQARILNSLQDDTFAFMSSHIHPIIPQRAAAASSDILQVLFTWVQVTLADYVNASLLPPLYDCSDAFQDGSLFMALLHAHEPECVPDLLEFLHHQQQRDQWQHTLETAFRRIHNTFHVPMLLDPQLLASTSKVDEPSIIAYLVEFIKAVHARNLLDEVRSKRHDDIDRFRRAISPSVSDGTSSGDDTPPVKTQQTTVTYSVQHVKLTKTTKTKSEVDEFQQRANAMMEKILQLQNRLVAIIPTRNYHASVRGSTSSATPDLLESSSEASECISDGPRLLHPLQAGDEDLRTYDQHFNTFQVTLQAFRQDEFESFQTAAHQLLPTNDGIRQHLHQVDQAFRGLMDDVDKGGHLLAMFHHGFSFSRRCLDVRNELDCVQMKMVRTTSTSTDADIQQMELRMQKAFAMIDTISDTFPDLLKPILIGEGELIRSVDDEEENKEAKKYRDHFDALVQRNALVKTWVEEVRVWFTEAQRIRQWITLRMERLEEEKVPDPLTSPVDRDKVDALNATHQVLEKEIELFDKEDMTRLRAHVKALTGARKDLSPADTTTIEITLTTLTALEKLMHTLRQKSYDLNVLTQRTKWEEELTKSHIWLKDADKEVEEFIRGNARWQTAEDDLHHDIDEPTFREQVMAQERLKELVIQRLLMLENMRNDFDKDQFSKTLDAFHDMDDAMTIDVPSDLEKRQEACEQEFDDVFKRINFARHVVEQRLKVMDFLYQTCQVKKDVCQLQTDLEEAQRLALPEDNDRDMTARVQELHERIVQLVTATASRIPYPDPELAVDKVENESSNAATREVISERRTELVALVDELDLSLNGLRDVLQHHRRGKQLLSDAKRLSDWADDRMSMLRKARADMEADTVTMDDLRRLGRDRDTLLNKLNSKENETIDVLTKIEAFLEVVGKMDTSIDRESLEESSQYLTNAFDQLQEMLNEHGSSLEHMRKKKEDGRTYAEKFNQLRSYLYETRASLPGLKQTCGFITGQSEEQDRQRYDMLRERLQKLSGSFREHSQHLNALREDIKHEGKNNEVGLDTIVAFENDWAKLSHDMENLDDFVDTVGQWFDRQRRLSLVENNLLAGLNESISELARAGWTHADLLTIEKKINEAVKTLDMTGKEIADEGVKAREDPLQTANYSRARDRHLALTNKAQSVQANLNALKKNADNAVALSDFLGKADSFAEQIQVFKENIGRRMMTMGRSPFAAGEMHDIEKLARSIQKEASGSEGQVREMQGHLKQLWDQARALQHQGYSAQTVLEPVKRIEEGLAQLMDTIGLEKRQAAFVKKTGVHAKAARDLQTWISQCSQAINQITGDVCIKDEGELRAEMEALEHKIAEIQPIVRAFKAMPSRILVGRDGQPMNLHEISVDPEQVKDAVREREESILSEWQQLANQLDMAKLAVQNSWRDVEIARKVKEILTLVGHLKDRTNSIRVSGGFTEDVMMANNNNDLKMIATCPLSMMPTEHELFVAKGELDVVDRDIEQHLHTKLTELDTMLNNNSDSEDIFAGQRTEIAAAVHGLTDILRMKREAIAEAEKLEAFLIVVEELEVMLSALYEVVERASPSYARVVDGLPSRADLQAMLIDLDTRYRYYEPKINDLMNEAKGVAKNVITDKRVVDCLEDLRDKWAQLQAQAASKRADLLNRIGPLSESFNSRMIKETTLARKSTLTKRQSMPSFALTEKPRPTQTTPRPLRSQSKMRPQSAMAPRRPPPATVRTTTRPQRPSPLRPASRAATKTPETYIPDPKNDLDMAVGNIVNDSPYKVRVKMVPGEVGRYWFGSKNPKLAYCRILRSRMVMVRVGGGWVELSQFLNDHSLLEDGDFVTKPASPVTPKSHVREGVVTLRGGARNPTPVRESRSTPFQPRNVPPVYGHGIKDGNKFLVPVDGEGNQVQVRMTKAKSKDTKFVTPRRTR